MILISREMIFMTAAVGCATIASVHDIRERRIPNLLTGPAIVIALGMHLAAGGWRELLSSGAAGLLAGGVLLLLFLAGGMGAGDVKLMAAVGCCTGLHSILPVLLTTALCGALLAIILAIRSSRMREILRNSLTLLQHHRQHGLIPHDELNISNASTLRMPFALPIAAGCLITAALQMWSPV